MKRNHEESSNEQPYISKNKLPGVVLQYLLSQGYVKTAMQLEQEHLASKPALPFITNDSMDEVDIDILNGKVHSNATSIFESSNLSSSSNSNEIPDFIEEDLIVNGLCNGNLRIYIENYTIFKSWILSSIDIAKIELLSICFPLFVHCYSSLARFKNIEVAKEFWNCWSNDHRLLYPEELSYLSMLTSTNKETELNPNQITDFLTAVRTSKYVIKISSFSYDLLTSFLVRNDVKIIASIINEHIIFERHHLPPSTIMKPVILQGYRKVLNGRESSSFSLPPVSWAVPGTLNEIRNSSLFSSFEDQFKASMPDTKTDKIYSAWIDHLIRPKLLLDDSTKPTPSSSSSSSQPHHHHHHHHSTNHSNSHNPSKGQAEDPSVIFATMTNTYDGSICLNITPDLTQAAAGFQDSCVRAWRLDWKKNDQTARARAHRFQSKSKSNAFDEVLPQAQRGTLREPSSTMLDPLNNSIADSPPVLQLRGHRGPVYSIDQTDSGRLIISGSADETVRLWDTDLARCVGKYCIDSPVWDTAFGPFGYYFAVAAMSRSLQLFSTDCSIHSSPLRIMLGHSSDVTCCTWHPNASLLASGSDDKTARLWDIRTPNTNTSSCVRLFQGSTSALSSIKCSPFGNMLAAGNERGNIHVWDIGTGKTVSILHGHTAAVYSLAFSPESQVMASGGADCTLRVWELNSLKSSFASLLKTTATTSASTMGSNKGQHYQSLEEVVLKPRHNLYTKFTPIYSVNYTAKNLIYAGGPFSLSASAGAPSLEESLASATETEAASALGLAHPVRSL